MSEKSKLDHYRLSKCNDCRAVPQLGAPVWKGEHTPAIWCQGCSINVGQPFDEAGPLRDIEPMTSLNKRAIAETFPEFTTAMRALRARARMKVAPRDISARILGERE